MPQNLKGNWNVRIKATVTKVVYCENCTAEQARDNPFDYAVDETEVGQDDYDVISIEPTE